MAKTDSKPDDLFRSGNTKLSGGKATIWGFGLPSRHTCPARTDTCSSRCYSYKLEHYRKHVGAAHRRNLAASKRPDFAQTAAAEITRKGIKVLRVHVGGELYSTKYARKWLKVFRASPGTRFFIWTRCWRLPRFRPVLAAMAALPNVRLWYSLDRDTGVPKVVPPRVRLAYMQVAADDLPPAVGDLVFRVHSLRKLPARKVGGVPLCPTETGLPGHEEVTCASCTACWKPLPGDPKSTRVSLAVL